MIPRKDEQMIDASLQGAVLPVAEDPGDAILGFLRLAMKRELADAVILPMKVPSGDSFAWIMIKELDILKSAQPLAPIMPVNAAKALKRYTRKGKGKYKIAALMKPCEIRATI